MNISAIRQSEWVMKTSLKRVADNDGGVGCYQEGCVISNNICAFFSREGPNVASIFS